MSRSEAHKAQPRASEPLDPPAPSNDVAHDAVLSPTQRASLQRDALALDARMVPRLPGHAAARLAWMESIVGAAWAMRDVFGQVPFEGRAVTEAELTHVGHQIEFAREHLAERDTATPAAAASTSAALRDCAAPLYDALSLRFANDPASRASLRVVGAWLRREHTVTLGCARLASLTRDPAVEAWLRVLPHGEGEALDRFRQLRREHARASRERVDAPEDLTARAFALCTQSVRRVLAVGRYLTRRDPARAKDFAGFHAPRRRRAEDATPPADAPKPG